MTNKLSSGGVSASGSAHDEGGALQMMQSMLADMKDAPSLLQPTNFWQSGLSDIVADLSSEGFHNFREHRSARSFYVPGYENQLWTRRLSNLSALVSVIDLIRPESKIGARAQSFVDGRARAFIEFQLFHAADTPGGLQLHDISESSIGGGERFTFEGVRVSRSLLNYLRGLAFLKKHADTNDISSVLEIGGGYGTMGEIILKSRPDSFYIDVDIPPVAAVATYYLQQVFGRESVYTYDMASEDSYIDLESIKKNYRAAVICPWQLPKVSGSVDLFVNFISFQEMEPEVVKNYAAMVQKLTRKFVLLRNSITGKKVTKAGEVGVLSPTTTSDMLTYFEEFRLLARDAIGCGGVYLDNPFMSEVVCMQRT